MLEQHPFGEQEQPRQKYSKAKSPLSPAATAVWHKYIRLSVGLGPSELKIIKLTSNTILITGGASGIGSELAKQLTALGNKILIAARDPAKVDPAKSTSPTVQAFRADVSYPEAI